MLTAKEIRAIATPSEEELKKRSKKELDIIEPLILTAAAQECGHLVLKTSFWTNEKYNHRTKLHIRCCDILSELGYNVVFKKYHYTKISWKYL